MFAAMWTTWLCLFIARFFFHIFRVESHNVMEYRKNYFYSSHHMSAELHDISGTAAWIFHSQIRCDNSVRPEYESCSWHNTICVRTVCCYPPISQRFLCTYILVGVERVRPWSEQLLSQHVTGRIYSILPLLNCILSKSFSFCPLFSWIYSVCHSYIRLFVRQIEKNTP